MSVSFNTIILTKWRFIASKGYTGKKGAWSGSYELLWCTCILFFGHLHLYAKNSICTEFNNGI